MVISPIVFQISLNKLDLIFIKLDIFYECFESTPGPKLNPINRTRPRSCLVFEFLLIWRWVVKEMFIGRVVEPKDKTQQGNLEMFDLSGTPESGYQTRN